MYFGKRILACLTILFSIEINAQYPGFMLTAEKEMYESGETLQYSIVRPASACTSGFPAIYVQLLNSNFEPVKQQIIRIDKTVMRAQLTLQNLDSGYYILRAFSSNGAKVFGARQIAIGINIPLAQRQTRRRLQFSMYPESGNALLNHTNRFALQLSASIGQPVQEKILLRNRAGQLIAVATTSTSGWAYMNIPAIADDELTFITGSGEILSKFEISKSSVIRNTGFALQAELASGQIIVEMRKAEGEIKRKAILEVFYNDILLHDATALFRGDTTIVGTSFSLAGLENKLLRLVLKNETGNIEAERLMMMPAIHSDEAATVLRSEIDCRSSGPVFSEGYSFLPALLNDQLISFRLKQAGRYAEEQGFSLFFQNNQYAGKTIDYAILQGEGGIVQGGEITADDNGTYEVRNCDFSGEAIIQFYEDNKQVMPFSKVMFPPAKIFDEAGMALLNHMLIADSTVDFGDGTTKWASIPNTDMLSKAKELKGVAVQATRKSRMVELEEKYVSNGMFKDMTARSYNVEDDPFAVNYTLRDYLLKKVPGIMLRQGILYYRQGHLDYYIDESNVNADMLSQINMLDIGYIKFFTTPVRGGMAAQRGGALLRGDSFAAGLQGSVAVYTKKYAERKLPDVSGLVIAGYAQE